MFTYIDYINTLVPINHEIVLSVEHRYSLMSLSDIEEWVPVTDA